jgi:hypothetical protein
MTEIKTEFEIEKIEEVDALERLKGVWNAITAARSAAEIWNSFHPPNICKDSLA